jgi:uncharacterized membrane protein
MKNKLNWVEGALVVAPVVALLTLWKDLPDRVPIHWNLRGQIDGWSTKPSLFAMPVVTVVILALLHVLPRLDPKLRLNDGGQGRMQNALAILRLALAGFFAAILFMQVATALGHAVPATRIVPASVLLLLAIIGNYLANLRPNYFAGIRTPWTLESPATWRATHRLGGRLLFFGSVTLLVLEFFIAENVFFVVFMTALLLFVAWTVWYPWHHFHTHGASALPSPGELR